MPGTPKPEGGFEVTSVQLEEQPEVRDTAVRFVEEAEVFEDSLEDEDKAKEISQLYRRASVSTKPSFAPGSFDSLTPLSRPGQQSQIGFPPPIPESLPTTPGFDLSPDAYFTDQNFSTSFPPQIASERKISPPLETLASQPPGEMSIDNPPKNKWRTIACVMWSFAAGFSDGAPGALLPHIESYYHVNYSVVSLIWLANAIGFVVVAFASHPMDKYLGRQWSIAGGCLSLLVMYAMVCGGPSFEVVVVGFFFGGIGLAAALSQINIFLALLKNSTKYLGFFHGGYGSGATVAPLVATAMVNHHIKWSYFYLILLGLMSVYFFNLCFAFSGCREDLAPWDFQDAQVEQLNDRSPDQIELTEMDRVETHNLRNNITRANLDYRDPTSQTELVEPVVPKGVVQLALKNRVTWYLSLFVLFYQGAEVSVGGWIVTYILDYRGGNATSTGYVASGFWGGLTVGRLMLTSVIHSRIGAKRGVTILSLSAIATAFLTWFIPNVIAEAVFVSLLGLFTGPVYPLMITIAVRVLPRKIQHVSLTICTAFGSSGGALFPFLVGLISQYAGAFIVMPAFVILFSATTTLWFLIPNPDRMIVKHWWQRAL
ncbi:unnamed protein product [Kuraishia capsulata CBS 1993]|uniref:Major facilitator superfamily (MFS) profile domain-containing protein n=1 Tax=Kuraishia capsulata CBS 1993 TaxID=1382522 RepID=W6MQ67_9ASCO|nr:uncharacterized protein KUCA_T00003380001 [Kuraishia capsulata CBS 1993]CDK27402.1 unnamed protein product [Kuraishia capsulata CBS 1993]